MAREIDVDVIDAVSDTKSLAGVPGKLTDAILACLERSFSTVGTCGCEAGEAADQGEETSAFGVATTRSVLAAVGFLTGEPVDIAAGLAGTQALGTAEAVRAGFDCGSDFTQPGMADCSFSGGFVAAAISSFPGCCRLDEDGTVTGEATSFATL